MLDWSPKQISGWLQQQDDESLRVSHETIYRSLFIQARGALKIELIQHLRSKRRIRRSQHSSVHGHSQGKIVDAVSIRERPAEVEDRAVPGHWEGDLLRGAGNSHVAARAKTSGGVTPLADLGPRTGDGSAQELHDRHECAGLLLRSAESLAARLERKHKRTFAAVPAEKIGSIPVHSIGAERNRSASQYPAATNLGISNSSG
jgi:IS30 family transposase